MAYGSKNEGWKNAKYYERFAESFRVDGGTLSIAWMGFMVDSGSLSNLSIWKLMFQNTDGEIFETTIEGEYTKDDAREKALAWYKGLITPPPETVDPKELEVAPDDGWRTNLARLAESRRAVEDGIVLVAWLGCRDTDGVPSKESHWKLRFERNDGVNFETEISGVYTRAEAREKALELGSRNSTPTEPEEPSDIVVLSLTERQRKIMLYALSRLINAAEENARWYSLNMPWASAETAESFTRDAKDGIELTAYLRARFNG